MKGPADWGYPILQVLWNFSCYVQSLHSLPYPSDHVILMKCINCNYSAILATLPIIYIYIRCVRKKKQKKNYIILQGGELTYLHFFKSSCTDGKWSTQQMYDFGCSRRFVLVRVWYLSSSEAYTNNWGLFGKENYLTFDWWKHFLKINESFWLAKYFRPFKLW
jgi:hypothetical protein